MPTAILATLLLLVLGIVAGRRSGRSVWTCVVLLAASLGSTWLLIAHATSDSFTGEGINEATLFHVLYGFEGAGFREYKMVILWAATALILAAISLGVAWFWRRNRPRRTRPLVLAYLFVFASVAVNPATRDLLHLLIAPPSATADFLRTYRHPVLSPTSAEHPNFVFIFAEGLERTYFDESLFPGLITELRSLESEGISFTDIRTVDGTGFTMGGIVASLCGIPLYTPGHPNAMAGMDAFLPGAIGLSDLLHDEGYYLAYMGGAYLRFAGKGRFLKTHKFDEMSDFESLHPRLADMSYINNWGLYDDSLFDLAFERFLALSEQKERFGLFLLTLDTHHPDGHQSKSVADVVHGDGGNPMLNAVAGSDRLIARFIRRIQKSLHGRSTVVVIASDHLAMHNSASALLNQATRRNFFLVLDPRQPAGVRITRAGSTLDTGTTLLPFLGYKGDIGLGRDLRDPAVSDAELARIRDENTLRSWRADLLRFWEFPRFKRALSFTEDTTTSTLTVAIDGRAFPAPVLVQLGKDGRATLRFDYEPAWLADPARPTEDLAPGARYLLVVRKISGKASIEDSSVPEDGPWSLIVGKADIGSEEVALEGRASVSKEAIDEILGRIRP